ncbi:ABC transporter permease [Planctomycetales bacterium]|nr:ABC transporter permease [Planctomycetales bacterium]
MQLLIKLILREAWYHRSRISLAVAATMAMSCMVVWLIGSIDLVVLQFEQDGEHYLGHYHVAMIPSGGQRAAGSEIVNPLRKDGIVVSVDEARQIRCLMAKMTDEESALRRQRAVTGLPAMSPVIIGIDTAESPFELEAGRWFNGETAARSASEGTMEGVLGTAAAQSLESVQVGDTVICRLDTSEYKVKIVGLVEQKLSSGGMGREITPAVGALYVSMQTADKIKSSVPPAADYYYVRLRDGANVKQFKETWSKHFESQNVQMQFIDADDIQAGLNQTKGRGGPGALMGNAASMNAVIIFSTLVSVLIVFTALSMGVTERARTFAMLRTVGMSRSQIAALVFGESVILCFFGWLGGMVAGWFVLQLTVWFQPAVFGGGKMVSLGITSVVTAGVAALIGSLLAAVIPAWRGAGIQPLEGMNRGYVHSVRKAWFAVFGVLGALLLTINPVIIYCEDIAKGAELRLFLYSYIGVPTQILGLLFLVPAVIILVEKLFTPLAARLLCVQKELLVNQLSGNLWRTFGTATALCIGLGVYSFLEISGYSMLVPYTHSKMLPNTIVTFLPTGIPFSEIDTVKATPGVDADRFLPIALEQPLFSAEQSQQFEANGMSPMQANAGVVVFGLNIEEAFEKRPDGSRPLVQVDFVEGTLASALEKLKTGERYCIVPDSFAFRANLHIGDKVKLASNNSRGNKNARNPQFATYYYDYEICGVVSIPGWLWMAKLSGIRKYGYRSGALMFAPYETVKNDFKITDAAYFWFDRTPGVSDEELEKALQAIAGNNTTLATRNSQLATTRPMVKVSSHDYLNSSVGSRADQVIQAAARMPLILLAISSLGMLGTVAASVRMRRFEFGVLRCLGVTRFGLVRLILAEALLIAVASIIISVGFGIIGGWCFIGLMRCVSFFGGFVSPLTIPIYYLSIGFAVTLTLCCLSAVGPALAAAHSEPATLVKKE